MAVPTSALVASLTVSGWLSTADTVPVDTPASRATSTSFAPILRTTPLAAVPAEHAVPSVAGARGRGVVREVRRQQLRVPLGMSIVRCESFLGGQR